MGYLHVPPCVLKTLHVIPWGTENHLWLLSPRCLPISLSPPLVFPSLSFIPGTIVQASSSGLLRLPCQKQKPFLTPDDQACSRFVWYVASAWVWLGGKCMLPIYIWCASFQGEQRLGEKRLQGAGSPQTIRFPERRKKDHKLGD